jgi:nucleoside-diphosphate-sugar epimerase
MGKHAYASDNASKRHTVDLSLLSPKGEKLVGVGGRMVPQDASAVFAREALEATAEIAVREVRHRLDHGHLYVGTETVSARDYGEKRRTEEENKMKVLFVGGTGNISTAVSKLAVGKGIDLYLLNRGQRKVEIPGAHSIIGDINQPDKVRATLQGMNFDAIVNWIAYTADDIQRDIDLFAGKTKQYVFISSASAYQKPPAHPVITESTPLYNPFWEYSRNKIRCEERLMQAYRKGGFPFTVVRPSLTYDTHFPIAIGGWGCYTLADRLKKGRKIIVHGDGSSLWTVTHAEDFAKGFVGLLGLPQAIGHAFHITSDEVLTWNQIYQTIADALGVEANMVHIPSDLIGKINPSLGAGLVGDKTWSVIFDNSKIKTFVPEFQATIPFCKGILKTLAWFDADESRKRVDNAVNEQMDQILAVYEKLS